MGVFTRRQERLRFASYQSASKHGRRTFLYSAMRELVCNGQLWARAVLRQLCSYKVGQREHFSATIWGKTMEITVVIQYILTATQSFDSQEVSNDDTLACWCIILRGRAGIDKMDYRMLRRKYLLGCLRKLGEFSKQQ